MVDTPKIEKGVPLLKSERTQWPFSRMEIDDSFFMAVSDAQIEKMRTSILGASRYYRPKKFVTRKEPGGVRCWRIA